MQLIITKYLEGRATDAEQARLLVWLRNKKNRSVFNSYGLAWKSSLDENQFPGGSEESWNKIQAQLLQKSFYRWQNSRKMNQFFRAAAIFIFVISLGSLAYFFGNQSKPLPEFYSSVIAENGHVSKVELPDGSLVWLNSGSKISYSNLFASNNRDINLTGEAYFQVTKNEDIPLVVNIEELQVKVLGTNFNVSAYPKSKKINVALESGRVELLNTEDALFLYKLNPGELAVFDKIDRKLVVSEVNTSKFTSWKEGIINFYNQPLEELIKSLENRYNQKFEIDADVKDYHYTFTIKNETLDEIIQLMEKITPIKAVQKGNIITFKMDMRKVEG